MKNTLRICMTAALAIAAAPAFAHAQARPNPIQRMLDLRLTDAQVATLQSAATKLDQLNAPLLAKLDSAGFAGPGAALRDGARQQVTQQQRQELRPVLQQMMENRRTVMQDVRDALTPQQQRLLRAESPRMRDRRAPRDRGFRPRR